MAKIKKGRDRAALVGWIPAALCALMGALSFGLPGCKLTRATVTGQEQAAKNVFPPRIVRGNFVMQYEASPGKQYPVHLTFQLDFNERSDGALFSTCVDSDGGLAKANAKQKIVSDKDVPLGVSGQSPDVALGTQVLPMRCAKDEPFQARVQAAAGKSTSGPGDSGTTANTAQGNTVVNALGTPTTVTPSRPPTSSSTMRLAGEPAAGTTAANTSGTNNETQGSEADGSYTFKSKPDAKGNAVQVTLRPNDAGWQVENLSYYGVLGWVEGTDTISMWGEGAK